MENEREDEPTSRIKQALEAYAPTDVCLGVTAPHYNPQFSRTRKYLINPGARALARFEVVNAGDNRTPARGEAETSAPRTESSSFSSSSSSSDLTKQSEDEDEDDHEDEVGATISVTLTVTF